MKERLEAEKKICQMIINHIDESRFNSQEAMFIKSYIEGIIQSIVNNLNSSTIDIFKQLGSYFNLKNQ